MNVRRVGGRSLFDIGARSALSALAALVAVIGLVGLWLAPGAVRAQEFPESGRVMRLIIPASPGGGTDIMGRTLARIIAEQNKVSVVVENKAGASGSIGVQALVNAPPDGYTIMLTLADATTIYPLLKKTPPYRADRDLTPIAQIAQTEVLFAVPATAPAYRSVDEFVQETRRRNMQYGSNGFGTVTHLWIELFKLKTGAKLLHVPYKGAAPAIQALSAGEVDFVVASPTSLKAAIDGGRARPLVAGGTERVAGFPNVPTLSESGYPDFSVSAWFGVFAPAKVSPAVADRLHAMVGAAIRSEPFRQHAETFRFRVPATTRQDFAQLILKDLDHWRLAIDAAGIKPED